MSFRLTTTAITAIIGIVGGGTAIGTAAGGSLVNALRGRYSLGGPFFFDTIFAKDLARAEVHGVSPSAGWTINGFIAFGVVGFRSIWHMDQHAKPGTTEAQARIHQHR